MGMVVMTYKVNPDSSLDDVDTDAIAETVQPSVDDNYDIQAIETKPLAFGLKFVQVHVKMNDGEGLAGLSKPRWRQSTVLAKSKFSRWDSSETADNLLAAFLEWLHARWE